ncbi:hypothetical protein HMPREF9406_0111 [Clostridium sp. HGF2]|nr:hypothetical protein HMPREF9406_0111 [Clostridium sp. HGF2]EQJ63939.1 hypothetical protein QSI_0152 [Clostridioides difficile P28]
MLILQWLCFVYAIIFQKTTDRRSGRHSPFALPYHEQPV